MICSRIVSTSVGEVMNQRRDITQGELEGVGIERSCGWEVATWSGGRRARNRVGMVEIIALSVRPNKGGYCRWLGR